MGKEIAMEDVRSIALDAMHVVQEKLKEFGITLTDEQDDEIYVPLADTLERLAGYPDYRSHN